MIISNYINILQIQNIQKINKEMEQNYNQVKQNLLNDQEFISTLLSKLTQDTKMNIDKDCIDHMIEEISLLLQVLVKKKIQKEMWELIDANNGILEEIKFNFTQNQIKVNGHNCVGNGNSGNKKILSQQMSPTLVNDTSFTDIHTIINEERRKAFEMMNDADVEKSISVLEKYQDVVDKMYDLQKHIKALEDRYETNFKSLWNVLSMTQAALFDFLKQNKKQKPIKQKIKPVQEENGVSMFKFWK